jgi:ketosteroid isomerase-like protein
MKQYTIYPISFILVVILLGCQPKTPAGLTEADQQAIREATAVAVQMGNEATEWTAYTQHYYAPDAIILPPNAEAIKGHQEIIPFFNSFPPISDMKFDIVEIGGAGDVAYVYGEYQMTIAAEGEMPVQDKGKYIEIWKRQPDGLWKVAFDIFNTDLPLPESDE